MWSVATALAFASALHVFTGVSLISAVIITAVLLFAYLQFGGMWAIGYTQMFNTIMFYVMLIVGFAAVFINPGIDGLKQFAEVRPDMYSYSSVGIQTIVAWFGTFIVNIVLAQAAFQMALSCKTAEEGKKGLLWGALLGVPLIIGAVVFGLSAAIVVPGETIGLIAIPYYLLEVLPDPLVALFFLGFWACALSWGAPCQFSGATSLGKDVGEALFPGKSENTYIRYTKWALAILTVEMIILATLRAEQSAWWNVLAWVTRNSATFAPAIAALFWPLATSRAVIASMIVGTSTGLLWYHLGNWEISQFFLQTHPVWPGMIANMFTLLVVTLAEHATRLSIKATRSQTRTGLILIVVAVITIVFTSVNFSSLYAKGLVGLVLFIATVSLFISAMLFIKEKKADNVHARPLKASS
jgi:SSS family solute:Na+ symporter